ncbi:hypothetical protein D9V32_08455 [Mycetocola tolaasinivorans]|uniref:Uncharacterized protein n=1 Tax=Mycetocola tolaasinivorans TaxID=76635 RepID=A0A3L7A5X3_9MICO|nr:hypothetical protein D9V32_08455 [Mycetocola tolaasinivorans]
MLRLRALADPAQIPEIPRFADVSVSERDGVQRFVAGYSTLSGPTAAGAGSIELWAHAPTAGKIEFDRENSGLWSLLFEGVEVLSEDENLWVMDNGFGVRAAPEAVTVTSDSVRVDLRDDAEILVISGPAEHRIRNRARLAVDAVEQLPSY